MEYNLRRTLTYNSDETIYEIERLFSEDKSIVELIENIVISDNENNKIEMKKHL